MKYVISNDNLQTVINQLGEEYKDILIERALSDTCENDVDKIKISELIYFDVNAKYNLKYGGFLRNRMRMLELISMVGMLYVLTGYAIMAYNNNLTSGYSETIMIVSYMTTIAGVLVFTFSMITRDKNRIKVYHEKMKTNVTKFEVINKWKEVEALLNDIALDLDSKSWAQAIPELYKTNIISKEDVRVLKRLLYCRNMIIHGQDDKDDLPKPEMQDVISKSDEVITKLKRLL